MAAAGPRRLAGATAPFPVADPALLVAETVEYPVQVNGKVRSRVRCPPAADGPRSQAAALAGRRRSSQLLAGPPSPRKVIVVPGRMVNVVV